MPKVPQFEVIQVIIYNIGIMLKKYLSLLILVALSIFTYVRFQNFEPKVQKQESVKGASKKRPLIPYPQQSQITSENYTEDIQQVTLKSPLKYKKIEEFYKSIFLEDGWKLRSTELNDSFSVLTLKKDKTTIKIISTTNQEDNLTTYSIQYSKE